VLVENLIRFREERPRQSWAVYNGYTATGVTVNHESSLLTEWDYSGAPRESFPLDGATPSRLLSVIQKDMFEWAYWERVILVCPPSLPRLRSTPSTIPSVFSSHFCHAV
jgi:hypothetical protein